MCLHSFSFLSSLIIQISLHVIKIITHRSSHKYSYPQQNDKYSKETLGRSLGVLSNINPRPRHAHAWNNVQHQWVKSFRDVRKGVVTFRRRDFSGKYTRSHTHTHKNHKDTHKIHTLPHALARKHAHTLYTVLYTTSHIDFDKMSNSCYDLLNRFLVFLYNFEKSSLPLRVTSFIEFVKIFNN